MKIISLLAGAFVLLCFTSCATLDEPTAARTEHIAQMDGELRELSERTLNRALSLQDCITIAMEHNYSLRLADLQQRMSELDTNLAFSAFLPTVNLNASFTAWRHQQSMRGNFTADKDYSKAGATLQMPLFMPSTWLLYANRRLGMEQAALTAHIARQTVEYSITVLFCNVLVCEDAIVTLRSQVESAGSLSNRMEAMFKEQQIRDWERIEAITQLQSRKIALQRMERSLNVTKGELLQAMGLSPMDASRLKLSRDGLTDAPAPPDDASLEEVVLQTLATHPELSIADRTIVQSENDVRTALVNFLPVISGFVDGTWTDDSIADRATNLYGGFSASMDVFSAFAKVTRYQASKLARRKAELDRNSLFLSIMMEVISAHAQLQDAEDAYRLAELNFQAMKSRSEDYSRRYDEGLVPAYEMLDAKSAMNQAEETMVSTRYQRDIAAAMLAMATGSIIPPEEPKTKEALEFPPALPASKVILMNKGDK